MGFRALARQASSQGLAKTRLWPTTRYQFLH